MSCLKRRRGRPGAFCGRRIGVAAAALVALVSASAPARADDFIAIPVLRLALGPAVHVAPDDEDGVDLGLDLTAGFVGMFGDDIAGVVVSPEIGYAYDSVGVHAFSATCGVGVGGPLLSMFYYPRLILGTAGDNLAVGMRNGLAIRGLADIFGVEVAHQFVDANDALHHDVRVQFAINVAAFGYVLYEINDIL